MMGQFAPQRHFMGDYFLPVCDIVGEVLHVNAVGVGAKKTRTVKVRLKAKKAGKVKVSFKVTSSNAGGKTVKKKIKVKK